MVYLTGDMHGDESRLYDNQWRKLKAGDVLIVCGDFGFIWDNSAREKSTLKYLGSRKFTVCFLDGPHENYDLLNRYRKTVWKGGKVHRISGNLFHLMRGEIYKIDGNRLFVFGGGESPDIDIRLENQMWWKNELPSPEELAHGAENLDEVGGRIDYILTHEPPALVKSAMLLRKGEADHVDKLNGYFEEIENFCDFKHWYFGCMHEDRTVTPKHTCLFNKILPLGQDFSQKAVHRKINLINSEILNTTPVEEKRVKSAESANKKPANSGKTNTAAPKKPTGKKPEKPTEKIAEKPAKKAPEKAPEKPATKAANKTTGKTAAKTSGKAAEKPASKTTGAEKSTEKKTDTKAKKTSEETFDQITLF